MDDLTRNLLIGRYWRLHNAHTHICSMQGHIFAGRPLEECFDYPDMDSAWDLLDGARQLVYGEMLQIKARLGVIRGQKVPPNDLPTDPFANEWGIE